MQEPPSQAIVRCCRSCGRMFAVCPSCYRGQAYCSAPCRVQGTQACRQRADMRWRGVQRGKERRRLQAQRRYIRQVQATRNAKSLGDGTPRSREVPEHGEVSCADRPAATLSLCVEIPDVLSPAGSDLRAGSDFRCIVCRCVARYTLSLHDHLAARERRRTAWLQGRVARDCAHHYRRGPP